MSPEAEKNYRITVSDHLTRWQQLREQLEETGDIDPETLFDTLEGATDLHEALLAVAEEVAEREAAVDALAIRIAALELRKSRNQSVADTLRNVILSAMDTAGLPRVANESVSLSVRQVKPKLIVDNEAEIPARFFVPADPTLDKAALKKALEAGEAVEGAKLSNGGITLAIRTR